MILSDKVKRILPYLMGGIVILYLTKPSISFKPNGQLRTYGFGYDADGYKRTLYTMQNLIILLAIILYLFN